MRIRIGLIKILEVVCKNSNDTKGAGAKVVDA